MDEGLLSLKWNNHRSSFISVLSSLRKKDLYCDVTLACEGKFYQAHKLVLSTCSDYFQDMFQQTQCKQPIIVLKDINCEDLESLLNYMYLGEVNVVQEKLSTLIKAAECLRIKGLAVPDDVPQAKESKEKRSSSFNDFAPESKRRRNDSDYHHKSNKPSSTRSDDCSQNKCVSESSSRENRNTNERTHEDSIQPILPILIKEEPVEDSKDGIFLASPHGMDQQPPSLGGTSSEDNFIASDDQGIWNAEGTSSDFMPADGDDHQGGANDDTVSGPHSIWASAATNDYPIANPQTNVCSPGPNTAACYSCRYCNYSCSKRANMFQHERVHTGQKPFACHYCGFTSAQKSNVSRHMRRRHNDAINDAITEQSTNATVQPGVHKEWHQTN